MHDLEQPDDCRTLVSHFYARVVKDPILAPIFAGRITSWDEHLDVMTAFWSTLLFGTGTYRRDAFGKHTSLALEPVHFERWLELWRTSVSALFSGRRASEAIARAEAIRSSFERRLLKTG